MAPYPKRASLVVLTALVILSTAGTFSCLEQTTGTLEIPGLSEQVSVLRDEKGMAYIYAANHSDALMAQGFVTAQDRLFSMELARVAASGRTAEILGESGKSMDLETRTIGIYRNAEKHCDLLNEEAKQNLRSFVDGINAYINTSSFLYPLPLKVRLMGAKPEEWTIVDPMAIMYYMGWSSSANLKTEITAQMLVEKFGLEKAKEIFPLNINPDDESVESLTSLKGNDRSVRLGLLGDKTIRSYLKDNWGPRLGSNNWAVSPQLSAGVKPIVANDPHLPSSALPGPWYPLGMITPEYRAVGLGLPGVPGILMGRIGSFAIGITNQYGDTQDLYVETIDPNNPDNYMEGDQSIPFEVIEETLLIMDSGAPGGFKEETLRIRLTKRGPVVSGVLPNISTDKVMTLRWSMVEAMEPYDASALFYAKTVQDVREALRSVTTLTGNFVFGDSEGNIGWQTTGRIPIRSQGDATVPFEVTDGTDNWLGWIPYDQMPQSYNPERGWVGTCNQKVVTEDFPYYFSSHFSPSYRYRRLIQLMETPGEQDAGDSWEYQRDIKNVMAEKVAPVMAEALTGFDDTRQLGEIIENWDHMDHADLAAPTIFQAIFRKFAILVYEDELGAELSEIMLGNWYFWQERLNRMVMDGSSSWFDNVNTEDVVESMNEIFHLAAQEVAGELGESQGPDPATWLWGNVHRMEFYDRLMPDDTSKGIFGGGSYPFPGSGETLHRGLFSFDSPFKVAVSASARIVVDLNDDDKIMAVLPGGVSGRLFHPHRTDQIEPYISGEKIYWWFSDQAITEHAKTELLLQP